MFFIEVFLTFDVEFMNPFGFFFQASAGLAMNVIAVFILTVGINTWGNLLFNFDTIPVIFEEIKKNQTLVVSVVQPIESMFNVSKPLV